MASQISLRKTGFVVFGSRLASVFTGLLFLIMVTRSLTPAAFGLWEFIYDLVAFASYPASVIGFWALRRVARGGQVAKTALLVSAGLSIGGGASFLVASALLHGNVGSDLSHFLVAAIMVPLSYWNTASISVAYGHRPTITGYALMISEVSKVLAAYFLLVVYSAGVDGVIVALEVAYFAQAATATYMCRSILKGKVDFAESRRWFVGSWVPLVNTLASLVLISDTFVAPFVFSGTTVVGYYQAAFSIANIVSYSSYLSIALYPLLLSGRRGDVTNLALDFSLLFGLPMVTGAVVLAKPVLFLLKPAYASAEAGLVILSFSALFLSLSFVLDSTLLGLESADAVEGGTKTRFRGTAFAFVPAVNLLYAAGYIGSTYLVLVFTASLPVSEIVKAWAGVQLLATVSMVAVKARKARSIKALALPRSLPRYIVAAALMGGSAFGLGSLLLDYGSSSIDFAGRLVATVLLSGGVYFAAVYALDERFRTLTNKVVSAIRDRGAGAGAGVPEGFPGPEVESPVFGRGTKNEDERAT
ncbi:MAG: hypothetical protein HY297_02540 [Thaumarchaeota archaeon]|nr:hypothetical protein [Nitrososphaerota archaeon]